MAEKQTAARPYAEAAFQFAKERNALTVWSDMLGLIKAVAVDENMARLAADPRVDQARFLELFLGVCAKNVDAEAGNDPASADAGNDSAPVKARNCPANA